MSVTPVNIIAGPADVEVDFTLLGSSYQKLGATQDGVTLNIESNVEVQHVDQVAVPVVAILGVGRATIPMNLAEAKFLNLRAALPGATEVTADQYIAVGSCDDDVLVPFRVRFTGAGPNGTTRTVTLFKAVAVGSVEQNFQRSGIRLIPTEFDAQSDGTNPLWNVDDV